MDDQILKHVLFECIKDRSCWVEAESEDQRKNRHIKKSTIAGNQRHMMQLFNFMLNNSVLSLQAFIYEFTRFKI